MAASLFKVKALYDFEAKEEDDLGFPSGQIIDVTEEIDDNWLEGKYTDASGGDQLGIFPREFVEKYEPPLPARPTRPTRAKQEAAPVAAEEQQAETETEATPSVPATSRQPPPPVDIPSATSPREEPRSPPSASAARSPTVASSEPPPAPKPAPAEPAEPTPAATAKKAPPPVAAKSNAFKDRIAAFNQPAAAPLAPVVPGGPKPQSNTFIKKPFVAPPPSANSYVPPVKHEPVHKPYIREEDPEIRRRREEDQQAAEAAGMTNEPQTEAAEGQDEDAPQPTSLKERIARLQQQQMEQAQRRAEGGEKKTKKPPVKKPSETSEQEAVPEAEAQEMEREPSRGTPRQSLDVARDRPRVPSAQRPQEPMSPLPTAPEHEMVSDGNEADQSAAGETTEDDAGTIGPEDSDEKPMSPPRASAAPKTQPDVGDEEDTTEDVEEDEDSMDEETRRKMALRERMAKMSGGMGMGAMFGAPGGMPMPGGAPPKKRTTKEKKPSEEEDPSSSPPQQRVPMIPVPGMNRVQSPESDVTQTADREDVNADDGRQDEDAQPAVPPRRSMTSERGAPPPVPKESRPSQERGPPPPVPESALPTPRAPESRPVPPPPQPVASPGPGSESDDESSLRPSRTDTGTPGAETPLPIRTGTGGAPPVPTAGSVTSPQDRRTSYFNDTSSTTPDKRTSRPPPPVPMSPPMSPRPPPPPPPTAAASRSATTHEDDEERTESDYEGDYDTDIASGAKHKDALKAHVREPSTASFDTTDDASLNSPPAPPPHVMAPRAVPPQPPAQAPAKTRPSVDAPRAPPPIPPTAAPAGMSMDDDDYDPYRYDSSSQAQRGPPPPLPSGAPMAVPPMPPREPASARESSADDLYSTSPPKKSIDRAPPPPPRDQPTSPPPQPEASRPPRAPPRQSLDVQRTMQGRRSSEQPRPSGEHNGQVANDINLSPDTPWWTAPQALPPVLQSRNGVDILSESEESTTSKRGGRTTVSKDIYVLFLDYSQTVITAQYDSQNPSDVHLEQRHMPPPPKLRQDQLENFWQRFGRSIADSASQMGHTKKETIIGDGTSAGFVAELIRARSGALQPVGTRAYGALVYANLANASTMQFDEIRPGDIVTLRNARFEGTHGAMKHKYKQEYPTPHVAVVEEWDGTRRALRGWEQGREKKDKGVRSEKFRLGDLKSGEVRVWRVVGREWVGWESG